MDYQSFKQAVIERAKALGIAEYELYYSSSSDTSVEVFQHEVKGFSSGLSGGVCFRCIVNGRMGYASTQALTAEEAAAIVDRAAANAEVLEADEPVFLCEGGMEYEKLEREAAPLPATDALIAKTLELQDKLYAADPAVIDGTESQGLSIHSETAIYNSKGLDLYRADDLVGVVAAAVVSDGQEMADAFEIKLSPLDKLDLDAVASKTVAKAKRKLGGGVPDTAQCPVVFSPDAMSDLLSVFSAIFSSENTQKGLSRLDGKEGEVIAAPCVTLVDDPFYPENPCAASFDDEGYPTHKKNVIENGRLNTLLYNLKTAAVAGKASTGNGSKAGYTASVNVSPFTMYLAPGQLTEEELAAQAGNGVYIDSVTGLHAGASAVSGDFSLQSAGFLIKDGKKTGEYVKSFTVAGNFYDLLKNITALGNKVVLPTALGSTAFASPAVLVEGLSIAGK